MLRRLGAWPSVAAFLVVVVANVSTSTLRAGMQSKTFCTDLIDILRSFAVVCLLLLALALSKDTWVMRTRLSKFGDNALYAYTTQCLLLCHPLGKKLLVYIKVASYNCYVLSGV